MKIIWFLGLAAIIAGAAMALGAAGHDYFVGAKAKDIGDSQLGAFFISLAVALFGAFLLQFSANLTLRDRIKAFEKVHPDIKAARLHTIKRLFEPVGMVGALAGLGMMLGLVLKDYRPLLNFDIGSMQLLAIFGGSVVALSGISFMATGNTFLSHSMGPMVPQVEGLAKKKAKVAPARRKTVVRKRVAKRPKVTKTPVVAPVVQPPAQQVTAPTPEAPPVVQEPVPVEAAPTVVEQIPKEEPAWSDQKAEEAALQALKEAETELGLGTIVAEVTDTAVPAEQVPEGPPQPLVEAVPTPAVEPVVEEMPPAPVEVVPEPVVEEVPPAPVEAVPEPAIEARPEVVEEPATVETVIEVFECPNCHGNVREEDTKCPNCGVSFEEEEEDGAPAVEAIEEEEPAPPPEPAKPKLPPPLPPALPPPLPPSIPKAKAPKPEAPPAVTKPAKVEPAEAASSASPSILQSILDDISVKQPATKVEEPAPVEEDEASEVPKTCPNCGRKIKPRWRSCPFCGLEFR